MLLCVSETGAMVVGGRGFLVRRIKTLSWLSVRPERPLPIWVIRPSSKRRSPSNSRPSLTRRALTISVDDAVMAILLGELSGG